MWKTFKKKTCVDSFSISMSTLRVAYQEREIKLLRVTQRKLSVRWKQFADLFWRLRLPNRERTPTQIANASSRHSKQNVIILSLTMLNVLIIICKISYFSWFNSCYTFPNFSLASSTCNSGLLLGHPGRRTILWTLVLGLSGTYENKKRAQLKFNFLVLQGSGSAVAEGSKNSDAQLLNPNA